MLGIGGVSCGSGPTPPSGPAVDAGSVSSKSVQAMAPQPLSADDVSWLFPAPTRAEDFAKLISLKELTAPNPQDPAARDPVWPAAAFQQFIGIAASPAAQVAGTPNHIGLPADIQSIDAWFIAGIRIDAGAPGLADGIRAQYGQSPQIRLIVQPVTRNPDGTPLVHDIAGHLIFAFTVDKQDPPAQVGCLQRPIPDLNAFKEIVSELAALRTKLSGGQLGTNKVVTAGAPLGVHPGLADVTTASNVRQEMKAFLERHISGQRLIAMAIMGLPAGAAKPWMFLSMVRVLPGQVPSLPNGGFIPVHGPTLDGQQFTQMLNPVGATPRVFPAPHTNNLNAITCVNAANPVPGPAIAARSGSATADVFGSPPPTAKITQDVLDLIADPTRSHFFNTDCVSCHTETRRAMELLAVKSIPGIDTAVLPDSPWNVRNFGWSPPPAQATVTRRTAAETAAVVSFINSEVLGK
ncbi:MAG: hypothetical protein WBF89_03900 [Steroidobacteraceae bacterium]